MPAPVTTRRPGDQKKKRPLATARRKPYHPTLPTEVVKTPRLVWPRIASHPAHRLPLGFVNAINHAFIRPCRIWDRARNIRFVLEAFNQHESVLPTKIRQFLERFEALD